MPPSLILSIILSGLIKQTTTEETIETLRNGLRTVSIEEKLKVITEYLQKIYDIPFEYTKIT